MEPRERRVISEAIKRQARCLPFSMTTMCGIKSTSSRLLAFFEMVWTW